MDEKFEILKQRFWLWSHLVELDTLEDFAEKQYANAREDIVAIAALVTVLNHKCWYWYDKGNKNLSNRYADLYYKYNDMAWDWLEKNGTEEEKNMVF